MKNKLAILNVMIAVLASACADTTYTGNPGLNPQWNSTMPNQYNPMNSFPMNNNPGLNTPYYNQNYNYNPMFQMNAYTQAQWNTQMMMNQYYYRQSMFSWQMRVNTPGYYNWNYSYRSCVPRPVYTTRRSVTRARGYCRSCDDVVIVTTTTTNNNGSTSTTTTTNNNGNNSNDTIKVLPISWKGADAKALFDRLAREEEVIEQGKLRKSKGVFARTGEFYKCMIDGKKSDVDSYVCDLEIRVEDGKILRQFPAGKIGTPVVSGLMYEGDLLKIGMPGSTPEAGVLTIAGQSAKYLFDNMQSEETTGTVSSVTGIEDNTQVKIRTAGAIQCFTTLDTRKEVTQCVIKLKTDTGEVLDGKTGSVQADPAPEASPAPETN